MKIHINRLKNNAKFVHVPIENSPGVTIMVLVRVGSRYETDAKSGLAHFVEHMFFKGTKNRPNSKVISMAIESIGGSTNAFTSQDYTGYYIKAPLESFDNSVEILADMILNGLFDKKEIDKERGVIIEEIRMYEDRPTSKAVSTWYSKFFKSSPLGRDIAGTVDSVKSLKREDFMDFVKQYYVADDMLIIVSGGIKENVAKSSVEKHFDKIQKGTQSKFEPHTKESRGAEIFNITKPIEQSHLVLGGYGFSRDYKNKYVLEVANAILSKGFGSRLFQIIRDELGLAYYVYSAFSSFEETGTFKIAMGVENSKVDLAVESVMKEFRKIMNGEFDDDELERAKNYLLGGLVTDMESIDDYAIWFGLQEILEGKHESVDEVKAKIKSVEKSQIIESMGSIFKGQNFLLTAVSPHKKLDDKILDYLKV